MLRNHVLGVINLSFLSLVASQPPKLMVLPKTNCQTWQTQFSLDRVDVPFIKKTHLFIPKEFIVKIRKTKRKGKISTELQNEEILL